MDVDLQQRAKAALESAKMRQVMRENQQLAGDVVHRLLRRVILKLNWVEEDRREREKLRKKLYGWSADAPMTFPAAVPEQRPSRRRERRKEPRGRIAPEYEEVPGGGQFLMMMLRRNQNGEGKKPQEDEANGKASSNGQSNGKSNGQSNGHKADALHAADPAILCVGAQGLQLPRAAAAPKQAPREEPSRADAAPKRASREEKPRAATAPKRASREEPPPAAKREASPPPAVPATAPQAAAAAAPQAAASPQAAAAPQAAAEEASTAGSEGGAEETLLLESLLPSSLLPSAEACELSPGASASREAEAGLPRVSKASMKIFGRLQSLMSAQEAATEPAAAPAAPPPLIPPMLGLGGIWGSPAGSGPTSSPSGSPWAPISGPPVPAGGDPWAPLPPSAEAAAGPWAPGPEGAARPPRPEAAAAGEPEAARKPQGPGGEKRGRRGGKHRDRERRAERLQDQDLWDSPGCDDPALLDLPEFFRDALAPKFVPDVLESPRPQLARGGPAADAPTEGGADEDSEWAARGWASGDEDSDEILLGRQLLG